MYSLVSATERDAKAARIGCESDLTKITREGLDEVCSGV
jgi:hypothetical protein